MKRPIEDEESSCASAEPTESKQAKLASDSNNDAAVAATGNTRNCTINRRRGDVKKAILMLMYSGSGYYGMQRNTGFDTIEGALFDSLLAGGHITEEEYLSPGKLQFQRASKTDKGVSALAQVVSMKLNLSDADSLKADVNSRLPTQIRLLDVFRTTKNFNCKARVNHREYAYICPSYAFASKSRPIDITYRIDSTQLELLRSCLSRYKGTKNYYNFTSDASCNRYIIDFTVGEPFEYRDAEFVELRVRGQSFMLHQIRKMVGLAIAIRLHFVSIPNFRRMDVPKAPGLGLLLNKINYGAYNEKYAAELGYSTVDWDRFEAE
uniref:Pseudouridylate synthase 1 homolog n=1 Tax=Macrostomum lignano TaxID=282301 RepID=A0A1I8GSH1_9PLAT